MSQKQKFITIFFVMLLFVSGGAEAQTRATSSPLQSEFASGQLSTDIATAVESANKLCIEKVDEQGLMKAAAATISQSVSDNESMLAASEQAMTTSALMGSAAESTINYCSQALKVCGDAVKSGRMAIQKRSKVVEKDMAEIAHDSAVYERVNRELQNLKADYKALEATKKSCYLAFEPRALGGAEGAAASLDAVMKAAKTNKALIDGEGGFADKTMEWVSENRGKVALGGLAVGALAYKVLKDDDNGGGGSQEKIDARALKAANADRLCVSAGAYEFAHCQKYLKSLCALPAYANEARCKKYSDNYCGLSKATGLSSAANSVAGAGLGSRYCQDTLSARYCSQTGRQSCYSCLELRDRSSPSCAANPDACLRHRTDEEMTAFKAACSDDPVFALPKWAHIQVPTSKVETKQDTIIGEELTQAASLRTPASADIAVASNKGVAAQSSKTIQTLCQEGSLNCLPN